MLLDQVNNVLGVAHLPVSKDKELKSSDEQTIKLQNEDECSKQSPVAVTCLGWLGMQDWL